MTAHEGRRVPVAALVPAVWNANRVSRATLAKVRRSIERFGLVENLVVRPHPGEPGRFEVISGNHRLQVLVELGFEWVPVIVVDVDDAHARILAQTLNRTRGQDDPDAYARLLERALMTVSPAYLAEFLPTSEAAIDRVLAQLEPTAAPGPPLTPRSRPGEVYKLGPHRLLCGDATDAGLVGEFLAGEDVKLLVTDPPYGVMVDHRWREATGRTRRGRARGAIANDDRADWSAAYALAGAPVAYVWHAAHFSHLVHAGLERVGYEIRQQIIWKKRMHSLGRAAYHWQHEPCWYAVKHGAKAAWYGGRDQTTVWEAASPIACFGSGGEERTAHPTQKPVLLFERPIQNHTRRGETVYDPFCGSGTCLLAAERTRRRCLAVELDPGWCDVIRDRYQQQTGVSAAA